MLEERRRNAWCLTKTNGAQGGSSPLPSFTSGRERDAPGPQQMPHKTECEQDWSKEASGCLENGDFWAPDRHFFDVHRLHVGKKTRSLHYSQTSTRGLNCLPRAQTLFPINGRLGKAWASGSRAVCIGIPGKACLNRLLGFTPGVSDSGDRGGA